MLTVKFDIKQVDKFCDKLIKELKSVKGVKCGYLKDAKYPNGFSLIANALLQEYGNGKVPPRPFMRNTLKRQKEWVKYVNEMFNANQDETGIPLKTIVKTVGLMMKDAMQDSIDSNIPPPNKPSTVKKKGSSHTLIDTGTLRSSIQYEVIENNDRS